jgi:uncharacterized delta-60 repeat protein
MKTTSLILTVLMFFHTILAFAQAGSLDNSFSYNGKVNNPAGSAHAVAVGADGKIIAGGSSPAGLTLVRYKANGSVDSSFGVNGEAVAGFGTHATVNSIALKASGKIIAAGTTGSRFAIAKFNADGSLDNTFGTNGIVTTYFDGQGSTASFVTILPDNKILVVGSSDYASGELTRVALARYNPDGSLDGSFAGAGKTFKYFNDYGFNYGSSIIMQGNKIVIVGNGYYYNYDFALARYKSNGDADSSFGTNGVVLTDFGGDFDVALGAAVQSDGKIVAAGYSDFFSSKVILARYTKNGKLDRTFGTNGKVISDFNGVNDKAYGISIQADDKIVIAGVSNNGTKDKFVIARFTKNGSVDNDFGNHGIKITGFNNNGGAAYAVAIQADGKIIAAGKANGKFALARYKNDVVAIADNSGYNISANDLTLNGIKLYPNPVTDILHITGINKESTISIFNTEGKLVTQTTSANQTYNFNTKQLPAGVYYLQVTSENKKAVTLKFVKQ